jgi:Ca-activated chloride channel family protein
MEPQTRERLVAYLLGEASAEEAAAVERELAAEDARGAELRAERERLAGTIGLVRAFGAGGAVLPAGKRADLEREAGGIARPAPVAAWPRRRAFAAAAALLLATGAAAVIAFDGLGPSRGTDVADEVAQAPQARPTGGAGAEAGGGPPPAERANVSELAAAAPPFDSSRFDSRLGLGGGSAAPQAGGLALDPAAGVDVPRLERLSSGEQAPPPARAQDEARGLFDVGYVTAPEVADGDMKVRSEDVFSKGEPAFGGGGDTGGAPRGSAPSVPGAPGGSLAPGAPVGAGPATPPPSTGGAVLEPTLQTWGETAVEGRDVDPATGVVDSLRAVVTISAGEPGASELAESLVEEQEKLRRKLGAYDVLGDDRGESQLGFAGLAPWAGDYEAMRHHENELLAARGLEPGERGLRQLLEGLGHVAPGSNESLDSPALLEVRWRLFGRAVLEQRLRAVLDDCRRRPAESLADMFFRHWGTRPFVRTEVDRLATFAADVDTASYTLARRMLDAGVLPGPDQIRVEEWINYFDAELERPQTGTFAITAQMTPNPFDPLRQGEPTWLLRVGLQGRVVAEHERSGLALTFVVDTSGSMEREGRHALVKNALSQLLTKLDARDTLAIVAFDNAARVVLEPTPATQRGLIEAAILSLGAAGGTNVEGGLVLGYELAARGYDAERENRVVLLSDGVGNIGETDQARILERVERSRANRILLNTIGVGLENHDDDFLEQLADRGDGVADYVDTPLEARRAFVERFTGAFQTIARDVKIQVEFDAGVVREYRLIGYENRAVADRAFRDDTVDGGEVGAGHSVVALFELRGVRFEASNRVPTDDVVGTVRVRWLPPAAGAAEVPASELARPITGADATWSFDAAPVALRKNVLVARVAEYLKRSTHTRGDSLDVLAAAIERAANESPETEFRAFAALFARHRAAFASLVRPPSPVEGRLDELRHLRYELEVERSTPGTVDAERVAALEARIAELEREVERLVFDGLASSPAETGAEPHGAGDGPGEDR